MATRTILTGALGASLLLGACGQTSSPTVDATPVPTAGRFQVRLETVADLKSVPATLTTRDMADARARIAGVLVRLLDDVEGLRCEEKGWRERHVRTRCGCLLDCRRQTET